MNYIQVAILHKDVSIREMLIAHLADIGFESFEEERETLYAYINETDYNEPEVAQIAKQYHCTFNTKSIEQENWNQKWEESFDPVVVDSFCAIRASFHAENKNVEHEIVITPKMSFGTGHHATTRLMVKQMQAINFVNQSVLDFGTGTGVLAILSKKLGAIQILAIDNDEWSYTNTLENNALNDAEDIDVQKGSLEVVEADNFDIILANINRHILLQYMQQMANKLNANGHLILSGILQQDKDVVFTSATNCGLNFLSGLTEDKWLCLKFCKDI